MEILLSKITREKYRDRKKEGEVDNVT